MSEEQRGGGDARQLFPLAGKLSFALFALLFAAGFGRSLTVEGRLPAPFLSLEPHLRTLIQEGELDWAIHEVRSVTLLDPNARNAPKMLAKLAAEGGDLKNEMLAWRTLLRRDPDDSTVRAQLARTLVASARASTNPEAAKRTLQRAFDNAEAALEGDPKLAIAYEVLGQISLERGKREDAISHFEEALRLDPKLETARRELKKVQES